METNHLKDFLSNTKLKTMKYKVKIKNPVFGVPISFLSKYCPEQFEILGLDDHKVDYTTKTAGCNSIKGEKIYRRLIIKHKTQNNEI